MSKPIESAGRSEERLFAFYWRTLIGPHRRVALSIFALMCIGSALEVVTLGLAVPLLQTLMSPDLSEVNRPVAIVKSIVVAVGAPHDKDSLVLAILVLACLLFTAHSGCTLLIQYVTVGAASRMRQETRLRLFQHYMQASYPEFVSRGRAAILHDVDSTPDAVYSSIHQLGAVAMGITQGVLLLSLMMYLSPWATLLIGLLAIGGVRTVRRVLDRRARVHGQKLYEVRAAQSQVEVDAIDGFKVVKVHALEDVTAGRLDTQLSAELRSELRLNLFRRAPIFFDEAAAAVIVIALGAASLLKVVPGLDFPSLVTFLAAIRRCSPAVSSVNVSIVELNTERRNIEAIAEILSNVEPERKGGSPVADVRELSLSHVSFTYPSRPESPALRDVSVRFQRGSITALVGPTGSGKSTLVQLLLGLMPPSEGRISADGVSLDTFDLAAWRKNVGYVPQDVFLFNTSIRENIVLWDAGASDADVERAARIAKIHDFIVGLPKGYDTVVGDRGVALSGGQCQRLAIARAVFRKPGIFIFDEATSALDNATERAVYDAIRTLREDAIVVVVAHRLSTIREADQIVVLESGRVVEAGTHTALLDRRGLYSRLFQVDSVTEVRGRTS